MTRFSIHQPVKVLLVLLGLCNLNCCWAQLFGLESLSRMIKQPDEFVEKMGQVSDFPDSTELFVGLFNHDAVLAGQVADTLAMQFWQALKQDTAGLDFTDSTWVASVVCLVTYKGQDHEVLLGLKPVKDSRLTYSSWRIVGALAGFLDLDSVEVVSISPASHNMDFFQLGKNLRYAPNNLEGMVSDRFEIDHLSGLILLFREGLLTLKSIEHQSLSYYGFLGYSFEIEESLVGGKYEGWGITQLERIN